MSWRKYLLIPRLTLASIGAPRSQARAWERYWDGVSRLGPDGDVLWDADEPAETEMLAAMLTRHADPGLPMVDLGCGSGRQAHALTAFGSRVIGVDGSAAAIARAAVLAPADAAVPELTGSGVPEPAGSGVPQPAGSGISEPAGSGVSASADAAVSASASASADAAVSRPADAVSGSAVGGGSAAGGVGADPGAVVFRVADIASEGLGERLHDELGDVNVHIRGVLHVLDDEGRRGVATNIAALLGERGTLYLCETNHTGDPLDYLLDQGARPTRLPPLVHRLIRAGVRAPRRFGPEEVARVFPAGDWETVEQGATEVYGIPLEPGGPVQRIPAWYAVVRPSSCRSRR